MIDGQNVQVRCGRRNGHTLYVQVGAEPDDACSGFIGVCLTPALAQAVTAALNLALANEPAYGTVLRKAAGLGPDQPH